MVPVLAAMAAGTLAGYFFRKRSRLFHVLDIVTAWIIRLLLFLLGLGIGADRDLLAQVPVLGAKGLTLAAASVAGSVAAARLMVGRLVAGPDDGAGAPGEIGGETLENAPGGRWKALGGSLAAAAAFALGLLAGFAAPAAADLPVNLATGVLVVLMFLVGVAAGADPTVVTTVRKHGIRMALLPLAVVVGTAFGCLVTALAWPGLPVRESLAVGAGFGYYSLSSLVIREISGGDWAAVALLSNVSREIITLLAAPLLAGIGGPAAPAAAGGATSMDTTLAVTVRWSGRAWAVPALFSGVVLTVLVPFAVTFILTL